VDDHLEIERAYEPPPGVVVPDLRSLPGVAAVGVLRHDELSAVYFDTPDLSLARAGASLRRRTGGTDQGWHLKLPATTGRLEVQVPLGRALRVPPRQLADAVLGWSRGAPLVPVATIETRRTTHALLGEEGVVLAELADDEVTGTRSGAAGGEASVSWREWEVELVDGDADLLDAASGLLAEAGAEPATIQRKVERVLGDALPAPVRLLEPGAREPAARVVHARLAAQVDELARRDVQVRRRESGGVHNARIACRRLRSALATFRPLLDGEQAERLRAELRWLAETLSDARDATVVGERLSRLLAEEDPALVDGPVARRLRTTYGGRPPVPESLVSPRYHDLRHALDALVADPPWTELAGEPACDVLPRLVRKDWKRLRRRYRAVPDDGERDEALHDVRKASKRLRYAAETLRPVAGKAAKRQARAAKELASYLGVRQDTVVTRRHLRSLTAAAAAAGEPTFTYGRLHAREEGVAEELDAGVRTAWRRVKGPARRWTC
jgi:CHAD domain-containing protein